MNEFMEYGFDDVHWIEKYELTEKGEKLVEEISKKLDMVNSPSHYTFGNYEVLDVIEDWNLGFHLGNVVKYIARAEYKGNKIQDLQKAKFYLDRYLELIKNEDNLKYDMESD